MMQHIKHKHRCQISKLQHNCHIAVNKIIVGIYTQSLNQICEVKRHLQADHVNQDKIGVFEPTFRFFSVHFFFLPSLIQPQHPPRKIFFREILRLSSSKVRHIYYIGLYNIILHLQDQVKYHICQKQTFFTVWCQSLSLVGADV